MFRIIAIVAATAAIALGHEGHGGEEGHTHLEAVTKQPTTKGEQYYVKFKPAETGGITGFFNVKYDDSNVLRADYSFSVDLSKYTGTCDLSQGLGYHLHAEWIGANVTATGAGCTMAENHYDPYLACGANSQGRFAGDTTCTSARGASYVYNCTPDLYKAGYLSNCEIGDLSGKYGKVFAKPGTKIFARADRNDPVPPLTVDFDKKNTVGTKWNSIVFHCAVPNTSRIVCAKMAKQ
jgi:hypothetical protein